MSPPTPKAGLALGPRAWLGIDPGTSGTGLALRARGDRYIGHAVIHPPCQETALGVGPRYFTLIAEAASRLLTAWADAYPDSGPAGVAVEEVVPPRGFDISHRRQGREQEKPRFVRPVDVMGLAAVQAAVLTLFPDALIVPGDGHGTRPLQVYPADLVTDRERTHPHRLGMARPAGKSADVEHARAAWDVARTAELLARARH